ncbi:serine/threonine-protein kinase [Sorangium sp. So ce176]|uniref:serine/threonine-protein kinase n=1 Tax=Sorangium sp. So ce176 TaxID=3133286 RepID=UPI003F607E0B
MGKDAAYANKAPAAAAPSGATLPHGVMVKAGGVATGAREEADRSTTATAAPPSLVQSQARPAPSAGTRIGHYELLRELGQGGMGVVFLARDTRLARLVAIKLLTRLSSLGVQRFLVEAQTTARCKHEHIVTIYEVNEHDGYPYMVLEYIEGQSLRAWMEQRRPVGAGAEVSTAPLPPSLAVDMIVPVVRALARAHASGIVHRDLKPENIMLEASGAMKVVDFGIAKLRDDEARRAAEGSGAGDTRLTRDGGMIGTLPYMSPEQWRGREIDPSSDIWAVGILLHELVLGAHPLAPCSRMDLLGVPALDEPMPEVGARHPEIGALIDRCLRKSKAERYASAEELLAELLPLLPGRREIHLGADECPFAGLSSFQEADAEGQRGAAHRGRAEARGRGEGPAARQGRGRARPRAGGLGEEGRGGGAAEQAQIGRIDK